MELFDLAQDVKVYYILIEPPIELSRELARLKYKYRELFGYGDKLDSPPHISLFQFKLDIQNEKLLVRELKRLISSSATIKAKTTGIEGFSTNNLISVAVEPESISVLHALMSATLQNIVKVGDLRMKRLKYPHITITHVPPEMDFNMVYSKFQTIEFEREFEIDTISLLRESSTPNRKWDKVKDFYLE